MTRASGATMNQNIRVQPWIEGRFEENVITTTRRAGDQLGPAVEHLAADVRPGLLRDRDDGRRREPLRHGPLRRRRVSRDAAAGRPDDRGRHGDLQNGQPRAPALQHDARSEVRDRDGRLHRRRRAVLQVRLPRGEGRRPGRAGRRVRARLPAAARSRCWKA